GAAGSPPKPASELPTLSPLTGFWPIFFLMVVLKIPVVGSIWLVWGPSQQEFPQPEEEGGAGGTRRRDKMPPKLPRGPRRGPHGGGVARPLPDCPPGGRTRIGRAWRRPPFPLPGFPE